MTRYCELCDRWMRPAVCARCGAATVKREDV